MTEPSEALKPCPFCGGDAEIALRHIGGTGSSGMETPEPFARCKSGCVEMKPVRCTDWPYGRKSKIPTGAQARKIAITAWNTRAVIDRALSPAMDAARRNLTDPQRMLWRDDVEGICQSTIGCFEYTDRVRCGPCAIKQAAALGVESDLSVPNLPEVYRLQRELAALSTQPTADAATVDRVARALEALIPSNIGTDNLSIPDGCTVPVDMTMGEIRAAKAALAAIRQLGPVERVDDVALIVAAAKAILDGMSGTYKARNGRDVGIHGDDGEKCWIVHSDLINDLEQALAAIARGDFRQSGEG